MSEIMEETKVEDIRAEEGPEAAEEPVRPAQKREKVPLTCRTWAKVTAFLLAVVMVCVCGLSVLAAAVMVSEEIYSTPKGEYLDDKLGANARRDGRHVANILMLDNDDQAVVDENNDRAEEYLKYQNIAGVKLWFDDTNQVEWSYDDDEQRGSKTMVYSDGFYLLQTNDGHRYLSGWIDDNTTVLRSGSVIVTLADEFTQQDDYWLVQTIVEAMYYFRYSVYVIIAVSAILAIACFVFLLCASGHHPEHEGVRPGWGTKIPIDALTAGVGFLACLVCALMQEASWSDNVTMVVVWGAGTLALLTMFLGWCMSFALRLKLGGWWKNSVCWWCLRLCWAVCKGCWRFVCAVGRGIAGLVKGVPSVWKILVLFFSVAIVEFLIWAIYYWEPGIMLFWWIAEKCVFLPVVVAVALMLRKLERGGQAIAEGDLSYQIDTKRLLPVFRRHAENLNCIGEGMNRAVEERTRSERMKTELITNVSHDIKTL